MERSAAVELTNAVFQHMGPLPHQAVDRPDYVGFVAGYGVGAKNYRVCGFHFYVPVVPGSHSPQYGVHLTLGAGSHYYYLVIGHPDDIVHLNHYALRNLDGTGP